MGVIQAKIQTVEDIYRIIATAIRSHRPIAAMYGGRRRLLCPHRLGRNTEGVQRVLGYQYDGDSRSGLAFAGSPANWRCFALEKFSRVELLEEGTWRTAPNHAGSQNCVVDVDVDAQDYPGNLQAGA
jgi:hypothetical protein